LAQELSINAVITIINTRRRSAEGCEYQVTAQHEHGHCTQNWDQW